ncbi:hypothetical protein [Qipengyuania sp. 483]
MAKEVSKKSASKMAQIAERKFADKIKRYAHSQSASSSDVTKFRDALGYGRCCNTMLASDLSVRRKAAKFFGRALESLRKENPKLRFHFWTFIHDRGNTSDRTPVLDLKFISGLTDRTLRAQKLDGIFVIEFQGLGNHPRAGKGRTIMTHSHALTWTNTQFDAEQVEIRLNRNNTSCSNLEAKPVRIMEVDDKDGELAYLAYYLFKPPYDVKMLEKRKRGDCLVSREKGYRPEFATRLLELLSQLELKELVRGCGSGKELRKHCWRRLTYWNRSRAEWEPGSLPLYYFGDLWDVYRSKRKKAEYDPFNVVR